MKIKSGRTRHMKYDTKSDREDIAYGFLLVTDSEYRAVELYCLINVKSQSSAGPKMVTLNNKRKSRQILPAGSG